MKIYPFKASYPKGELITSPKSFFSSIKHQYREYKQNNFYKELGKESLFVYRIKNGDRSHVGILTLTDVKEMSKRNVMKHEKTLAAKEQQMMHLIIQRNALVKPVLLGYKSNSQIKKIVHAVTKEKPLLNIPFKAEDEVHTVWQIKDENTVSGLVKAFSKIKKAYIGDGHHRSTTIKLLSQSKELGKDAQRFKLFYTAYFPFEELRICDYNRAVDINEIMSIPEFIVGLSKYFDITPIDGPQKPKKKHHVTTYIDGNWYRLKWRAAYLPGGKKKILLDSALLNKHIFGTILGIKDVRVDTRISYFGGTQPLGKIENAVRKMGKGIGFCIYPVSVKELTALADSGETLPPKSTWFLPRLRSGVIAHDL